MTALNDIIAAARDTDLRDRVTAAAEEAGIPNATQWAWDNMIRLVLKPSADGQVIADAHAYATATRNAALAAVPPPPGQNPAAVLDAWLRAAVRGEYLDPTPPPVEFPPV